MLSSRLRPLYTAAIRMPQLTLTSNPGSKQLSLSPQKPIVTNKRRHYSGGQVDLRALHKEEEDMAASNKSRAKAMAEGKSVPMFEEEDGTGDVEEVKKEEHEDAHVNENDRAKGQPGGAKKRSRSPEGGGVAGSRDTKRHKNAYEISACQAQVVTDEKRARSLPQKQLPRWTKIRH